MILALAGCSFPNYGIFPGNAAVGGEANAGGSDSPAGSGMGGESSGGTSELGGSAGDVSPLGGSGPSVGGDSGAAGADWGPPGIALQFDGTQIVLFEAAPTDDLTIEMWIKTTLNAPTGNWYEGATLFGADLSGNHDDFGASLVGSSFAFGTGKPDVTALSQTPVNTGQWFHVAGSRERSSGIVRVVINGRAESTLVTGNTRPLTEADLPSMGGHFELGSFFNGFVGLVDEVRLWNVVRTPTQIKDNMRTQLNGDEPGLVGYWRFDDGAGLVAADLSPSNAPAKLGGDDPARAPQWLTYPEQK